MPINPNLKPDSATPVHVAEFTGEDLNTVIRDALGKAAADFLGIDAKEWTVDYLLRDCDAEPIGGSRNAQVSEWPGTYYGNSDEFYKFNASKKGHTYLRVEFRPKPAPVKKTAAKK